MYKKLSAVAAAAVVGAAGLPALPALASAASTATLVTGSAVYPGQDQTFTIRVTNNEPVLFGKTINAVRINLPMNEAGIVHADAAGSAPGFTSTKDGVSAAEFITFRGGSIRPGSSVDFTVPADVLAPSARDLTGDFRVQVSSDDFATSKNATGDVLTRVQVLEILQDGLKPVAPQSGDQGVADRSGTAGQAVTYVATVRNHAKNALSVSTSLTSNGGDTATPTTISVPGGGQAVASIPVRLGSAASDRTAVLTAAATATGATAPTKTDAFTVQAPAAVSFTDLQPTRTTSGTGSARTFTTKATKTGTPALTLTTHTLSFGSNSAPAVEQVSFDRGASSRTVGYDFAEIAGTNGALGATIATAGKDDNLASYSARSDLGQIVIDNLAPVIALTVALPKDADGDQQVAVGDGDAVTVSGTVTSADDVQADSLRVVLQPDNGPAIEVTNATLSGSGSGRTFTGSASPDWDDAATRFTAKAEVLDTAGNRGGAQSLPTTIDNVLPALVGPGVVVEPTKIRLQFTDTTGVAGGCDENTYLLDGTPFKVADVRNADGSECSGLGSGGRALILKSALSVDATPRVTYDVVPRQLGARPAKDGAGNDAVRQTVDTVTNLVPQAPPLVSVERRDGAAGAAFEEAYLDEAENRYYTNVPGADALRITIGGIRQNYRVEVVRSGTVVARRSFTDPVPLLATDYEGTIDVPVPATDGLHRYSVRLVSAQGNAGAGTPFDVALDRVRPALGAGSLTAGEESSTVAVPFSELVVAGTDFADDWFVSEMVDTENGTARRTVNANSVSGTDERSRVLEVTLVDPSRFAGVDYYLQSPSGRRYEDRAGNTMADTLS